MREAEAVVKQQLRKARAFLIRRATRQSSRLLSKHGDEDQLRKNKRKAERFSEQVRLAKDVDLDLLAQTALLEGVAADRSSQLQTVLGESLSEARLHRQLILAEGVQKALQKIKERNEDGKAADKERKKKTSFKERKQAERKRKKKGKKPMASQTTHQSTAASDGESDIPSGLDDLVASDFSDDELTASRGELSSLFVRSMKETSGSKKKGKPAPKKPKNRPGQRSRQKVWEKKFGRDARHIVENRPANKPQRFGDRLKKQATANSKELKRAERRQHKANQAMGHTSAKPKAAEELHPSWVARRQAKEQATSITAFQGSRVTFDDSD